MTKLPSSSSDYEILQWTLAGFVDTYMGPGSEGEVAKIAVARKAVYVCAYKVVYHTMHYVVLFSYSESYLAGKVHGYVPSNYQ